MEERLSSRQEQCLRLSATMTDKEIARALDLSPHTVNMHIRNAMRKLDVTTRKAAIARITENPLYEPSVMAPELQIAPTEAVNGSPTSSCEPSRNETSQAGNWALIPARIPPPPLRLGARICLVLLVAFLTLIISAAILGLFGFVFEIANRWAVDPIG